MLNRSGLSIVILTAASTLGQMLLRYCREEGVPLVCIVRSPEHVELLRGAGAEHVCDSSAESFEEDLMRACAATGATLAFDAIGGGRLAGRILACMESAIAAGSAFARYGSATHKQAYLYGNLDRGPTEIDRSFGMAWGVGGWVLPNFLARAQLYRGDFRIADLFVDELREVSPEDVQRVARQYMRGIRFAYVGDSLRLSARTLKGF